MVAANIQETLFNHVEMKGNVLSHYVDSSVTQQNEFLKGQYSYV